MERLQPVTESARTRRKVYRITDNFLAFYLGALSRVLPEIDRGLGETVLPVLMASLDDHMGDAWEEAFRDHLRLRATEIGPEVVAIGPWWRGDGQHQIDAVALSGRSRTPILVGEAKWGRRVNAGRIAADLAAKAAHLTKSPGNSATPYAPESPSPTRAPMSCASPLRTSSPRDHPDRRSGVWSPGEDRKPL
nr:hypothetical protein GCM10020093_052090 [Planobispora longispora]